MCYVAAGQAAAQLGGVGGHSLGQKVLKLMH